MTAAGDDELIDEQIDFYRTDATAFDDWLVTLVDPHNHEPVARAYRAGRDRATQLFARRAPLGDVLEIAAGTGRLAELYVPHADSALLVDASPEILGIAARRIGSERRIGFLEADVFEWKRPDLRHDRVLGLAAPCAPLTVLRLLGQGATGLFENVVWAEATR